jgi:hypothetical protein
MAAAKLYTATAITAARQIPVENAIVPSLPCLFARRLNGRPSRGSKIGAKRRRSDGANYGESRFLRHAYLLGNRLPLQSS